MSDTFGYPSDKKCVVCGGKKNNQIEPRFFYTVCEDHQGVPPTEINLTIGVSSGEDSGL